MRCQGEFVDVFHLIKELHLNLFSDSNILPSQAGNVAAAREVFNDLQSAPARLQTMVWNTMLKANGLWDLVAVKFQHMIPRSLQ